MLQHDYSQLPVVDEDNHPLGLITHQSILRVQKYLGPFVDNLKVSSAMTKHQVFRPGDDLFDLLDRLKDENALLIVDGEGRLIGIVTGYDSTEYFRRRSEDMMRVRDVETMVKDLIRARFGELSGQLNEAGLNAAVAAVTGPRAQLHGRYVNAVRCFLHLGSGENSLIDQKALDESFAILAPVEEPKQFEQLSFHDYVDILLHHCNEFCRQVMDLDPKRAHNLLEGVRETRNLLAHFRDDEISPAQRDQLQFCNDWLNRIFERMKRQFQPNPGQISIVAENMANYPIGTGSVENITDQSPMPRSHTTDPPDEALRPNDSRYAPLALWLQGQPLSEDRAQVSFEQIERIIGSDLPPSARSHRGWWANDSTSHVQSQEWLSAGWRASYINLTEEQVVFARIRDRESAYIAFWSALLTKVRNRSKLDIKDCSPDGRSWITVASLPELGPKAAHFVFSFARGKRFRVELYLDTGIQAQNKAIFDELARRKDELERMSKATFTWERLDERRASRIAIYHSGEISDADERLLKLHEWASDTMTNFHAAIAGPVKEALDRPSGR
jgi:hypothetical protein